MSNLEIIESFSIKSPTKNNIVNLVLETIDLNKQVLIFNSSKSSSEKTAEDIANSIKKSSEELEDLSKKILKSIPNPTRQCRRLAKCVLKGVAFHHSGLTSKQKTLIEDAFKSGLIRVISSTPTLAAGLNLPAYKVIIKDYKRYSSRGYNDIPVLEYHQMSGRAGRPGKEEIGKSVLYVKTEDEIDRITTKYIFGSPEEIISKLAVEPTLKMYILSLVSMDIINTKPEIEEFFKSTLYAYQYKDLKSLNHNIFRILDILKEYDFIAQEDGYYIATPVGKKVSELYLNPDTAYYFIQNIPKFFEIFSKPNTTKYDVYQLLHFICNTLEMKPLFRVFKYEEENYIRKIEDIEDSYITQFDPFEMDYNEFINTFKTADILEDWINEAPEDYICEKYKITPGELNYKNEVVDWLLYCLEEISIMKKNFYFKNFLNRLRIRFKVGIKSELLPLISLKGIGRVRARKLFNAGLKKIYDLKRAEHSTISRIVGESLALKIKKQISEDTNEKTLDLDKKPKEIKVRSVTDDEIEELIEAEQEFEKEKISKQTSLNQFF